MARRVGNPLRTASTERTALPDGSIGVIEWQVPVYALNNVEPKTYMASRQVDGITVWGQVFTHDPDNETPTEGAAALILDMMARPSAFDRRALWCVKCGAGASSKCEHPAPYTAW
jgi:hypothetical protein